MKTVWTVLIMLLVAATARAAGPTVSIMTEQIANVDYGNSLGVELGYFLGIEDDGPGLEPYIGTDWWPQWDDEGDMQPPSIFVIGVLNHFGDIVDPNSAIPFIPDLFTSILNEQVTIKPYIGFRFSANFIDKDAGKMSIPAGILVKTTPESNTALRFEVRYNDTFGDLSMVPDDRLDYYMGIYIPF